MITLGLGRISQLLNPLFTTHPTLPWRAVHITGTNGKGSVAALISTLLDHLGYRVGRFTSPHLIDRWDCITVDRAAVAADTFLAAERHFWLRSASEDIRASEFEILTAAAFQIFTDERVDVAVVECGLGGREDATNVLRTQDVALSVLTKVGLDHTEFLGGTVEAIAAEKAGIFKRGVPVVLDRSNASTVVDVVEGRLEQLGWGNGGRDGIYVPSGDQGRELAAVVERLALAPHQAQNLHTAFAAFRCVEDSLAQSTRHPPHRSTPLSPKPSSEPRGGPADSIHGRVLENLVIEAHSSLPGRFQWLTLPPALLPVSLPPPPNDSTKTRILLDGAHNADSAAALAESVTKQLRGGTDPITWLLSVKADKDADSILGLLVQPHDNVVACSFGPVDGMPWVQALGAADLAVKAMAFTDGVVVVGDCDEDNGVVPPPIVRAIHTAVHLATKQDEHHPRLCIAGSLYLAGDVLRCIRDASMAGAPLDGPW